ncbi:RTX toxin, partial [Candidatus Magnetomorum sp. HK-1]
NGTQVSAQSDLASVSITVQAIDDAPYVASPLISRFANEDDAPTVIDLSGVFDDIDNDPNKIQCSLYSNTKPSLLNASVNSKTLTLTYLPDQFGEARITILALSNGKTEQDSLTITVNPIDDAPIVNQALDTLQVQEDSSGRSLNLSSVFTDKDNDDTLITKSIQANSNSSLVQAIIAGNTLSLSFSPDQYGTATITIQGQSNGKFAHSELTIQVDPVDDPPQVVQSISDVNTTEDAPDTIISLIPVFSDKDNDNASITHSILNISHPDICSARIENKDLIISPKANQYGSCTTFIQAESDGLTASTDFTMTITPIDDPPVIKNPISMVTAAEDDSNLIIPLSPVFTDVDNDDTAIIISVTHNTRPNIISTVIENSSLTLSFLPNQNGQAEIYLIAQSSGKSITHSFSVNIQAVDDLPFVSQPISNIEVNEDADITNIDLSTVFSDIDDDDNAITKQLASNTNSLLLTPEIVGNTLSIDYKANKFGEATLVILGQSNGKNITTQFHVLVNPI